MRLRLDRILLGLASAIFIAQGLVLQFSWYLSHPWVDIPLHIAGGLWLGLLFFYLFFERSRILSVELTFLPAAFLCAGFVMFIGVGWEVFEYLVHVFVSGITPFGGSVPGLYFDTLKDLFDDLLGGLFAVALYYRFKLRVAKSS